MNQLLRQYLLEHHRLDLPGLGCIRLERVPASFDFGAGLLHSPSYTSQFSSGEAKTSAHFISYLSNELSISPESAQQAFDRYLADVNEALKGNQSWTGLTVGQLTRQSNGTLHWESQKDAWVNPKSVPVDRIIRSVQMDVRESIPAASETVDNRWWMAALVLTVISSILILMGRMNSNSWLFNP